jgi:hypothetical protein
VNLLLFIGVGLRTSGCYPTSREEIEPCIKKSTRGRERRRKDSNVREDVNKSVGTFESCQLLVSHKTIANFAFIKYDWVRKVEGMSLGS